MIIIRKAVFEDCRTISLLKREVWNTTYRGIYSDAKIDGYDVDKHARVLEGIVQNPEMSLFTACDGERIIGFISCGTPHRPFLHYKQDIGLMYILDEYQRQGIGRRLFTAAINEIKENGHDEFFTSVNKYNTNAISFYEAMGGRIILTDEDKEDKRESQVKLHYDI